jgi:hypothetical protein
MYLLFGTQEEAEKAQAAIWQAVRPPAEIRDGKAVPDRITQRWATPRECKEGWVIEAPPKDVDGIGGKLIESPSFPEQNEQ